MDEFSKKKRFNLQEFENTFNNNRNKIKPSENMDSTYNIYTGKSYSQKYFEILSKRKTLPAWEAKEHLKQLLDENQVIILQGETGSGKTTQVPQFLVDFEYTKK